MDVHKNKCGKKDQKSWCVNALSGLVHMSRATIVARMVHIRNLQLCADAYVIFRCRFECDAQVKRPQTLCVAAPRLPCLSPNKRNALISRNIVFSDLPGPTRLRVEETESARRRGQQAETVVRVDFLASGHTGSHPPRTPAVQSILATISATVASRAPARRLQQPLTQRSSLTLKALQSRFGFCAAAVAGWAMVPLVQRDVNRFWHRAETASIFPRACR